MKPTLAQIENAFQPAKEISDADRFAGRKSIVSDAHLALISEGAHIAIVGNRGIGKTSLARQISAISIGKNELLKRLNIQHDTKMDFMAVYFACGGSILSTGDLLEAVLTVSTLSDWLYDIPKAKTIITSYEPKVGANIGVAQLSLGGSKKTEDSFEKASVSHSVEATFTKAVSALIEQGVARDGLLIVVDEFDQIEDPSGFAGFLKALSTNVPKVKFCIVGVASDIQHLMKEHKSADRLFAGAVIHVKPMTTEELVEVIRIAERSISSYVTFDLAATERLVALAQGHPYMVHLIGKHALRIAFAEGRRQICGGDIDATLKSMAERGSDPVLEGRYKKAVGSSEHREIVLKALAECQAEDGEVWTGNAYKLALEQGVDNSSQYVGQLVTEEYGGELEKLRDRYYRFHDSLFAAYVRARPRLIEKSVDSGQLSAL